MAFEKPSRNQEVESQQKTLAEESDEDYNFRIWAEKARKITEEVKQPQICVRCQGAGSLPDYSECPMCSGCGTVIPFYSTPF